MSPVTLWEVYILDADSSARVRLGGFVLADTNLDSDKVRDACQKTNYFSAIEVVFVWDTGARLAEDQPIAVT